MIVVQGLCTNEVVEGNKSFKRVYEFQGTTKDLEENILDAKHFTQKVFFRIIHRTNL